MTNLKLTETGRAVLERAYKIAKERESGWPNESDILNALLVLAPPIVELALERPLTRDLNLQTCAPCVEQFIDDEGRLDGFLKLVDTIAVRLGHKYPGPEHFLLALATTPSQDVCKRLSDMNLDPKMVYERVLSILGEFEIPDDSAS